MCLARRGGCFVRHQWARRLIIAPRTPVHAQERVETPALPIDLAGPRDNFHTAMIEVTENAVRHLRSLLQSQDAGDKGLRVQIAKGGCSGLQYEMLLDEKKNGDAVVERDGVEFFVDAESASMLKGSTLDYHDGLTGTGFRIVNPNATRTCGCGTSFEAARSA